MALRARQTGSAFTAWTFTDGNNVERVLALCQEVAHRAPQPVTGAVEVHPLNYIRPTEIIVPRAITHGEVTLTVLEQYDKSIFDALKDVLAIPTTTVVSDLADLFNWMMTNQAATTADGSRIELQRIIRDPNGTQWRKRTFKNARIVDVRDEEQVRVDTLVNPISLTVWYTQLLDTPATKVTSATPIPNEPTA